MSLIIKLFFYIFFVPSFKISQINPPVIIESHTLRGAQLKLITQYHQINLNDYISLSLNINYFKNFRMH